MLGEFAGKPIQTFVIWEPVLLMDWTSPSTASLARIPDTRARQFWDKRRLVSHLMGEHDHRGIVWDRVEIYAPAAVWRDRPPPAFYEGGPVVQVIEPAREALARLLEGGGSR